MDGLHTLIQSRKEETEKSTLLNVLKHIRKGFVHKKGRKRITKFIQIIENNKNITLKKITFYVYYIHKILHNVHRKPKEISIKNFESMSGTNECADNCHITGACPELYIKRYGSTNITSALLDSGAESNILDLETLERMFSVSREEVSPLKHQLSLRGSTGLKLNAILGQVNIKLSFLQEQTNIKGELEIHK